MLALQVVGFGSILFIIVAFLMYQNGYKKQGIQLCRATFGAVIFYVVLVLSIGLAPVSMG